MTTRKEHILLVDDEKHLLVSLRDYLMFEHFTVTTAQSGEEAVEVLQKIKPDLIVLDISMPGMGGMGFLRHITTPQGKTRYPVLVLTARSMLADFFQGVAVDGFMAKPCDEAELTGMIRAIIAKHRNVSETLKRGKMKVLLGEDDEIKARRLTEALKNAGYDVVTASSGPQLLEKAVAEKPDLIVIKEILSLLNGHAVASLLEVMPSANGIPIVIHGDPRSAAEGDSGKSPARNIRKVLGASDQDALIRVVAEVCATL